MVKQKNCHDFDLKVCRGQLPVKSGQRMGPGCTMGSRYDDVGSVMLRPIFCLETMGPAIGLSISLMCNTYPTLSWKQYSVMAEASFSRIILHATKQKQNDLGNTTSSRCCLQIAQICIQSIIYGMCCMNKSNPPQPV